MVLTGGSDSVSEALLAAVEQPNSRVYLYGSGQKLFLSFDPAAQGLGSLQYILPGIHPAQLGDASMLTTHGITLPYVCGEMANGIATAEMVAEMARHGLLGFFGAGGLTLERIERALVDMQQACGERSWGANLIHSPHDTALEEKTVDLFLRHGVRRVSASAFMAVRPSIVRYACTGLRRGPEGSIERRNHVFAKISRPEVARQFLSPAPEAMLRKLVEQGQLTAEEASLAQFLPVAEDITAEADSGGHTDNRPLVALLPAIFAVRDELAAKHRYTRPIRIGAAGGIGTPTSVSAAFSLGASYVLTGSVNQSARESGLSSEGKRLIAEAGMADVMMAPAGDMFELGVKVQVLKRGTLFGVRAAKLYDLYTRYESLEELPAAVRASLEKDIFQQPLESVWAQTADYFQRAKPEELVRAAREPKHRMALVFRWYLGLSSKWPILGEPGRRFDYQIWCGPAMGAFNQWVAGSFLESLENRTVVQIAWNLMWGAAKSARAQQLRTAGFDVPASAFQPRPQRLNGIAAVAGEAAHG